MSSMFYRAFEERYRGSRELIRTRLEVYLPFIEPLKVINEKPLALDLGCGRGEWLELLQQHGFQATGVDLDEGMLLACRERNLDVIQADAIQYIKKLPSESLSIISAFHFVEHISFEMLREIVDESRRVLKPGGILILETPNSENLLVGTSGFYLDPTHQRPVPALLLSFLIEFAGFERVKTIYLQEQPDFPENYTGMRKIFEGVSPDYAVVTQKKAIPEIDSLFDAPFKRDYGVRLISLAERYDRQIKAHMEWCHAEINKMKTILVSFNIVNEQNSQLNTYIQTLQNELDEANKKSNDPNSMAHFWWTTADAYNKELQAIYKSKLWRLISRLRKLGRLLRSIIKRAARLLIRIFTAKNQQIKSIIKKFIRKIITHPEIAYRLSQHPYLKYRLRQIAIRFNLLERLSSANGTNKTDGQENISSNTSGDNLSLHAIGIYSALQKTIKEKEKT